MVWEAKHGVSKHPLYVRWNDMIQRCYNSKAVGFEACGGKGIVVSAEWDRRNPKGALNFITWLEERLEEIPEEDRSKAFVVARRKVTDPYSPETCYLTNNMEASQKRGMCVLDFDTVVQLRQYKKANPKVSLRTMCKLFGIDYIYTLSRCLKGITWSNVDDTESPIADLGTTNFMKARQT